MVTRASLRGVGVWLLAALVLVAADGQVAWAGPLDEERTEVANALFPVVQSCYGLFRVGCFWMVAFYWVMVPVAGALDHSFSVSDVVRLTWGSVVVLGAATLAPALLSFMVG